MLKVGLIGFGLAGQAFHAPIIQGTEGLELACVLERSTSLAKEKYPGVRIARTLDEMLADEEIRLCVVATPNTTHFPLTRDCLLAGRDVLVDKPFTPTLKEAEELVHLAQQQKRVLTVYHSRRWDGDFQTVKKIVEAGTLGEIGEYESRFDRFRPKGQPDRWRERPGPGAGVLFDLGPHLIDQAMILFGTPQAITTRLLYQRGGEVDDAFDVCLEYARFRATLRARVIAYAPGPRFIVHGTKGSFLKSGMDPQEDLLRSGKIPAGKDWGNWGEDPEELWGTLSLAEGNTQQRVETEIGDYRRVYANLRDAILKGTPLEVTTEQALRTMKALELAHRSHREKRTVAWNGN